MGSESVVPGFDARSTNKLKDLDPRLGKENILVQVKNKEKAKRAPISRERFEREKSWVLASGAIRVLLQVEFLLLCASLLSFYY